MRKQIIITFIFAGLLAVFLSANIWLESILVKPFANEQQLEQLLTDQRVRNDEFSSISQSSRTLIHVSQSFCICNAYSSTHIQTLSVLADEQNMQVLNVSLDKLNDNQTSADWQVLLSLIPATPATILINSKGKIEYIGPYSSGLTCNSGNSFIEGFLTQPEGEYPIANWINTGCYCSTK